MSYATDTIMILFMVNSVVMTRSARTCKTYQFRCPTGRCLPYNWVCNGYKNCPGGEDEPASCSTRTCKTDQFRCPTGSCLPYYWVCNGSKNCPGGEDEPASCSTRTCKTDQFRCPTGRCLPSHWVCGGIKNCPGGEDEPASCSTRTCKTDQFRCPTGSCLPYYWVCNGDKDCPGGEDEPASCSTRTCKTYQFRCPTGRCLPYYLVCNGDKECPGGEDEPAFCSMSQSTTKGFDQTVESTVTTTDVMGKSSSTVSEQNFDTRMTCSQVRMDESGSKVIWNCRLTGVFPKAICQVEYFKHQISFNNSALPPLNHHSTHTASATKPDFVDSVCTMEMPAELLDAGTYTFIMSMQPDVFDGSRHVQSVQSDFILVKHNAEASRKLDTNWIIGGTAAAIVIFLFICFFIGFCLFKNGKGENSTKADNQTVLERGINLEGLNMDTPSNSDEHPIQITCHRPMAFNETPTPRTSPKEKQPSKQQKPKRQQESGDDFVNVYANPGSNTEQSQDLYVQPFYPFEFVTPKSKKNTSRYKNTGTGKRANQNHAYHHNKSNKRLNTPLFEQQQQQSDNMKKAMLPRNRMENQQQKNAAFDPSEEYLEPVETRNILSGTGRPSDGVTAAGWDEGPTGSDDENIYDQAIDSDAGDDDLYTDPDQDQAIPVSDDTEIAMEDMYMSI